MARKIELQTVNLQMRPGMVTEDGSPPILSYGQMIDTILRWAPPQKGLSLDEVTRAMEALAPVTAAVRERASEVVLTDEQYKTLIDKLAEFPFGIADEAIVQFGSTLRNAPEIGLDSDASRPVPAVPRRVS